MAIAVNAGELPMMPVIQLEKRLDRQPVEVENAHFQLRSFNTEADIETWLRVRQRAFTHESPPARGWTPVDFDREIRMAWWWNPAHCWFAFHAHAPGECVGTVLMALRGTVERARQVSANPDRASSDRATPAVHWLAVVPEFRRLGAARLLLNRLERTAWRLGHRRILLETHAGWTSATSFYTAMGYRSIHEV